MMTSFATSRCPICSRQTIRLRLIFKGAYPIAACANCKHQFMLPQPTDAVLAQIYTAHYFLGEHTPESEAQVSALKRATATLYIDTLVANLGSRLGRLLEIGCGTGDLLAEAQLRGFEVAGLELSSTAVQTANQRLGGEYVQCGTLDAIAFQPATFDVCVMADVIEHVRDPLAALQIVRALLKPDGVVLLVTPSLDSWSARLMGRWWMEYKIEHLSYFGNASIRKALARNGFVDIQITSNFKILSFDYITNHFQRFPVPLLTPISRWLRRLVPSAWATKPMKVVASGMLVIGRKHLVDQCKPQS
jgi:2-polyprenyl-3-methyl-5-hydroxy-6-metoxy-1,4-benzoquinol methylase